MATDVLRYRLSSILDSLPCPLPAADCPLERRLKRVRGMPDDRVAAVGPDDGDDVEPRRGLGGAVAAEVHLGGLGDLVPLQVVDLVLGLGVVVGAALHFHG